SAPQGPAVAALGLLDHAHALLARDLSGGVGAGVVDDDDLDLAGVVLRQERVEARGQELFFVVRGNDDGDARRPAGLPGTAAIGASPWRKRACGRGDQGVREDPDDSEEIAARCSAMSA